MMCSTREFTGSCGGAEGGPLMTVSNKKVPTVVGLYSWTGTGAPCGSYPDVDVYYTRVRAHIWLWCEKNTGDLCRSSKSSKSSTLI